MASDLKYGKGSALWDYWTKGEGFAKWASALHKWTTLHRLLIAAGVPAHEADGLTTNIIQAVMPGYMKQAHAKGHRMSTTTFTRSYPLDDIKVRSGGDGRPVEAYASVFDTPAEIKDQDGHYHEVIDRRAFDKTIAERGLKFGVFYNHGMTLHGTPSERHSMPIGTPVEVRADKRGVLTVTKYNRTQLADEVLESIREGAITGQSFSGRMIQSSPGRPPYRARNGSVPTVTRTEIAMREYGPTPMPAYEDAGIVGVRALLHAYGLGAVDLDELGDLNDIEALRTAVEALARGRADTTNDEGVTGPTTPEREPEADTDTPAVGAVTAEPEPEQGHHSGPVLTRAQARARLLREGILL
jgi:HK97 family phage prohead protease